jgi:hypothetical protein
LALPAVAGALAEVAGKDLPKVPGPMTGTSALRDLSNLPGDSRMDLAIRRSARRTPTVPAVAVPAGDLAIRHAVPFAAGWMAYKVEAAPGERIQARLAGVHEGWFKVRVVNRFGDLGEGMLQNLIQTGNPEASYQNPGKAAVTVFFVVDTTVKLSGDEPYTLSFRRQPAPASS